MHWSGLGHLLSTRCCGGFALKVNGGNASRHDGAILHHRASFNGLVWCLLLLATCEPDRCTLETPSHSVDRSIFMQDLRKRLRSPLRLAVIQLCVPQLLLTERLSVRIQPQQHLPVL